MKSRARNTKQLFFQPYVLVSFFYLVFPALLHWAVLSSPNEKLLFGSQSGSFFTWLNWYRHAAFVEGWDFFFTKMIFAPVGIPVFFSSPLFEILSIPLQFFVSPVFITNIIFILVYSAAGISSFYLFFRLSKDPWAAFCGSFIFAFSKLMIVQHWHGHLYEMFFFLIPLLVLVLFSFGRNPDFKQSAKLAALLVLFAMSGPYVLIVGGFLLIFFAGIYYLIHQKNVVFRREIWIGLMGVGVVVGLSVLLMYWPVFQFSGEWRNRPEIYPTHLTSFINAPFWHRLSWVQSLRISPSFPEADMAYLGLGVIGLIAFGFIKGMYRKSSFRFYFWIFMLAAIFSLGPELHISQSQKTNIPLPYKIFQFFPLLSNLRVSGRVMMIGYLALGALVSLVSVKIIKSQSRKIKAAFVLVFIALYSFELDLPVIGNRYIDARPASIYEIIKNDPEDFMVLNLPNGYTSTGNSYVHDQYNMFMQTFHQKPILLGHPPRVLKSSFDFTDKTPLVYELTHPWVLKQLRSLPQYEQKRKKYFSSGAQELRELGIKYIVFDHNAPLFEAETMNQYREFLPELLGDPIAVDKDKKVDLYKTL